MLNDPRGTADDVARAARGLTHDDSAKHRSDESNTARSHASATGAGIRTATRLPGFAVPVGAAVLVIAVVGGALALTSGGEDKDPATTGADSGPGAEAGAGEGAGEGSGAGAGAGAGAADPAVSGSGAGASSTFTGTTQFNFDSPNAVGTTTVSVTCDAGCTVTVDDVTGHNDNVRAWVPAALAHVYAASGGSYTFTGTAVTSCDAIRGKDVFAQPELWTTQLTVTDDEVTLNGVIEAYDGDTCSVSRTEVTYTGVPAP